VALFAEELEPLRRKFEGVREEREQLERDNALLVAENATLAGRAGRLEADLERATEERQQALGRAAELQADLAQLPVLAAAADGERKRAELLAGKLETAREKLAEAAATAKELAGAVKDRDEEIAGLVAEVAINRVLVDAVLVRAQADETIRVEVGKL
jgi:predicted RNase H-like nuclease (RuvC/YqgF family)